MKSIIRQFGRTFECQFNLISEEVFQHHVIVAPYLWFAIFVKYANYSQQKALRFAAGGYPQLAENMMNAVRVIHVIAVLIPAMLVWNLYYFFNMPEKKDRPFSTTLRVTILTILALAPMAAYVLIHRWFGPY